MLWSYKMFKNHLSSYYEALLSYLKDKILPKFLYLFHVYDTRRFYPFHMKENMKVLLTLEDRDRLKSSSDGKLIKISERSGIILFEVKNFILLGAPHARVKRVVDLTFLVFTIEITNPFNKESLKKILTKKFELANRLIERLKTINQREWNPQWAYENLDIYKRKTLLQYQEIVWMQKAVKRAKKTSILIDAENAIKKGLYPVLITRGLSGSYWMRATDRTIAGLFKPFDEELFAPNNPIGANRQGALGQRKARPGSRVGESPHREVAAYLVDQFFSFGIVPRTFYASFTHYNFYDALEGLHARRRKNKTKLGSFQEFVDGFVTYDNLSEEEKNNISLVEIHLLIALDIIIGNSDRNTGNLLIGEGGQKIAAVDHGLCLTDLHIDPLSLWPMGRLAPGKEQLLPSLKEIFFNFPYEELSWKLKKRCFIPEPCVRRMRERVALFRAGLKEELVPYDLGGLIQPENLEQLWELDQTLDVKAKEITEKYIQDNQLKTP